MNDMLKASPEEQAKWWAGLSEADRQYLIEGEDEDGPFAEDLMRMDGGIPQSAQEQAKATLQGSRPGRTPPSTRRPARPPLTAGLPGSMPARKLAPWWLRTPMVRPP